MKIVSALSFEGLGLHEICISYVFHLEVADAFVVCTIQLPDLVLVESNSRADSATEREENAERCQAEYQSRKVRNSEDRLAESSRCHLNVLTDELAVQTSDQTVLRVDHCGRGSGETGLGVREGGIESACEVGSEGVDCSVCSGCSRTHWRVGCLLDLVVVVPSVGKVAVKSSTAGISCAEMTQQRCQRGITVESTSGIHTPIASARSGRNSSCTARTTGLVAIGDLAGNIDWVFVVRGDPAVRRETRSRAGRVLGRLREGREDADTGGVSDIEDDSGLIVADEAGDCRHGREDHAGLVGGIEGIHGSEGAGEVVDGTDCIAAEGSHEIATRSGQAGGDVAAVV